MTLLFLLVLLQSSDSNATCGRVSEPLQTEQLVLVMKEVGLFLAEMSHFHDSEDILLQAHTLLIQVKLIKYKNYCSIALLIGYSY